MTKIDIEKWNRKKHYLFFKDMTYPLINVNVNVDITNLLKYVKSHHLSFAKTFLFVTTKALNSVAEMRMRIRDDEVIMHDIIHPSFTVLGKNEVFHFCEVKYIDNLFKFSENAEIAMQKALIDESLSDEPGRDDYIFVSSLPWFSFNSITHPINNNKNELSVPRLTWGKYFESAGKTLIPLSIEVNHALVDGIHIAKFLDALNSLSNNIDNE
ncbi:MAG: chloramphenicol acetyltransferase [Bacilli bacterium]|nr:chloramphenicol acetyltransferase [Bacilli bacterium]